jgi:hypothetical protein
MNRAVGAFGRFLLKDWDLLVFLVVAAGWERVTGVPFTVRTAVSLIGCWLIFRLLWRLGISLKVYRDKILDTAASEKEKGCVSLLKIPRLCSNWLNTPDTMP